MTFENDLMIEQNWNGGLKWGGAESGGELRLDEESTFEQTVIGWNMNLKAPIKCISKFKFDLLAKRTEWKEISSECKRLNID